MNRASWSGRLHRLVDGLDHRFRPALRRAPVVERAWIEILDLVVAHQPDRAFLRNAILPALARSAPARLLFVGVRGYTRSYGRTFRGSGTEFWTADIDPAAAPYGAPGRHRTANICAVDQTFAEGFFEAVLLNGVFGWGVDDPGEMDRALVAIARVLVPGGLLLIGWNTDRCLDPDTLPAISLFKPVGFAGLPHRTTFADVTHVYAWYRAR